MTENAPSWTEYPVVSGLLVFDRPQQVDAARASVNCFFDQSWPNKELVVFNATRHRLTPWYRKRRYREITLKPRFPAEMLALCAENANGEWVMNWMPDCWYDAEYIKTHMEHRAKNRLLVLRHKQVYSLTDRKLLIVSNDSVLCWSFYRHIPVKFDKPILDQFEDVAYLDNPAHLVVKFASEIV